MSVDKLPEFAKNGQKNTDGLNQEDGFPVNLKPARQWFNFLFNTLSLSINQIIDQKLDATSNAVSASKWQTARTISYSGAATGSVTFDGSANASCVLTLANSGVAAGTYASTIQIPQISVNAAGQITAISQQNIRSASVTQSGVVLLTDDLTTDDSSKALTARQGKKLQDEKFNKTGGKISGSVQLTQDNSVITVGNNDDVGFAKKSGAGGFIAIGKTNNLVVKRSSLDNIGDVANDTFTTLMILDAASGALSTVGGFNGNASTASKLAAPKKIFGQDFDGSNDVAGNIVSSSGWVGADIRHFIDTGADGGKDRMIFNVYTGVFIFYDTWSGKVIAQLDKNGINCNASTASKLAASKKIFGQDFDGSNDITGNAEVVDVKASGWIYADKYVARNGGSAAFQGNADTASKLLTARSIALSGAVSGNANFDGSGNINIETTPNNSVRAFINFNMNTGAIRKSSGIASVTSLSSGVYRINLSQAAPDANYAVVGMASWRGSAGAAVNMWDDANNLPNQNSFCINCSWGGDNTAGTYNPTYVNLAILY